MAFGLAETAKLAVDLSLKGNFSSALAANQRALTGFNAKITDTQGRAYKAGQQIGTGIKTGAVIAASGIAFLLTQVGAGIRQLAILETATAQTNAVLKSTKGVAGQTSESVRKLAEEYENLNATIDDKVIQSGENLLLTFTNIRKEAFEPALRTALDLNTRLGGGEGGLQNTIKLLGKALNDPLKGLGALSKAGITFNKQQTDQIKTLVKNNDLLGAQDLILKELGKRYGGAFAAEGKTATGTFRGIGDAVEDLQKALATGLFPTIQRVLPKLRAALADPAVIAQITKLGDSIAGLFSDENLKQGGAILGSLFETAKAAAPVVGEAAKATLTAVKAAVSLFTSLPKEVQQLAIGAFAINKITGGLVTNIAGGLISSVLKQLVSGVVNVQGAVVNVGGAGGVGGAVAGGASKAGRVLSAVGKVFIVGAAVGAFAELASILRDQSQANKTGEAGLSAQTGAFIKVAGIEDMKRALAGIEAEEKRLNNSWEGDGFAFRLNIDGVRDAVEEQKRALQSAILRLASDTRSEAIGTQRSINRNTAADVRSQQRAAAQIERAENRSSHTLSARINAARVAITAAGAKAANAARGTTEAVKDKDLSVTVPVTTNVSIRDIAHVTVRSRSFGRTAL